MTEQFDIVIVGGGIGGGALAARLVGEGLRVLVLEKSTVYPDLVRGEWIAPWGVVELQRLGLYEAVLAGGACSSRMPTRPADLQVIGTEGDVHFLVFPQGKGRVRLYLGYAIDQSKRFAGSGGPQAFLDAFRLSSVPGSELLAGSRPAGPCNSYPNEDTWTDTLYARGVLLLGDAAGSNDPIIGQGLSITLRDVGLICEALLSEPVWSAGSFAAYASERRERMRRLRFSASVISTLLNEFGPAADERRQRVRERQMSDPGLPLPLMATLLGPHNIPAEAFAEDTRERLFAS